jgi:hypothetical protein
MGTYQKGGILYSNKQEIVEVDFEMVISANNYLSAPSFTCRGNYMVVLKKQLYYIEDLIYEGDITTTYSTSNPEFLIVVTPTKSYTVFYYGEKIGEGENYTDYFAYSASPESLVIISTRNNQLYFEYFYNEEKKDEGVLYNRTSISSYLETLSIYRSLSPRYSMLYYQGNKYFEGENTNVTFSDDWVTIVNTDGTRSIFVNGVLIQTVPDNNGYELIKPTSTTFELYYNGTKIDQGTYISSSKGSTTYAPNCFYVSLRSNLYRCYRDGSLLMESEIPMTVYGEYIITGNKLYYNQSQIYTLNATTTSQVSLSGNGILYISMPSSNKNNDKLWFYRGELLCEYQINTMGVTYEPCPSYKRDKVIAIIGMRKNDSNVTKYFATVLYNYIVTGYIEIPWASTSIFKWCCYDYSLFYREYETGTRYFLCYKGIIISSGISTTYYCCEKYFLMNLTTTTGELSYKVYYKDKEVGGGDGKFQSSICCGDYNLIIKTQNKNKSYDYELYNNGTKIKEGRLSYAFCCGSRLLIHPDESPTTVDVYDPIFGKMKFDCKTLERLDGM